jgi:hypothetical protein
MSDADPLVAEMVGAAHDDFAGIVTDTVLVGEARVKRLIYPPGLRWSTHIQPIVGGELCNHAHVGFLARGHLRGEYADGCGFDYSAPSAVMIEPGHDAWVIGDEPAVLIQFDYEGATLDRLGVSPHQQHGA